MNINIKMPKLKFKKIKMDSVEEDLENVKIDYENIKEDNSKKKGGPYPLTHFKTVKEFFYKSAKEYPDEDCILEKPDHKEPYKITTYAEFKRDVDALGTALIKLLNQRDKRVVIIGETQYGWYASYMAMLCRSWYSCSN